MPCLKRSAPGSRSGKRVLLGQRLRAGVTLADAGRRGQSQSARRVPITAAMRAPGRPARAAGVRRGIRSRSPARPRWAAPDRAARRPRRPRRRRGKALPEQRVAAGVALHLSRDKGSACGGRPAHGDGGGRFGQRGQLDQLVSAAGGGQHIAARQRGWLAVGNSTGNRRRPHGRRSWCKQAQAGVVGPLQVVDEEQLRRFGGPAP